MSNPPLCATGSNRYSIRNLTKRGSIPAIHTIQFAPPTETAHKLTINLVLTSNGISLFCLTAISFPLRIYIQTKGFVIGLQDMYYETIRFLSHFGNNVFYLLFGFVPKWEGNDTICYYRNEIIVSPLEK